VLKEMSVSIFLYLVYGRRRNLKEGARGQMPSNPPIFFLLKNFFLGGGGAIDLKRDKYKNCS
jgi:hypothetical protein